MKLLFGIFTLLIVTIAVQGATKIEIYEIRDSDNGLQLKNMNSNPKNNEVSDPILSLLRASKPKKLRNKIFSFTKNLLKKLKILRAQPKPSKYYDDPLVYILNSDDFDENSSNEESPFTDKTRTDRASKIDKNDIRDLLLQLFQPESKTPLQQKRKPYQKQVKRLLKPVLRDTDRYGDSPSDDQNEKHAYVYINAADGQNNIDRDDQSS